MVMALHSTPPIANKGNFAALINILKDLREITRFGSRYDTDVKKFTAERTHRLHGWTRPPPGFVDMVERGQDACYDRRYTLFWLFSVF